MKILVVDHDPQSLELLSVRLKALEARVVTAVEPDDVVRLAQSEVPDLMIINPEHRTELITDLRNNPMTARIPMYIHSVYVNHTSDLPKVLGPVDGILPKPFKNQELEAILANTRQASG